MLGLYIHVPFCAKKCPYCDFYSVPWRIPLEEQYLTALKRDFAQYKQRDLTADTVYFGGGTPSLIRPQTIAAILTALRENFTITPDAEITLECNPCTVTPSRAAQWAAAGINRVSLGMQSASEPELKLLGRRHSPDMVKDAVDMLRDAGIHNISLDIMMALPHQTSKQLRHTIDFAASMQVQHISAYLLQIEPGTPFAESEEIQFCPDEDTTAQMYRDAVQRLASHGYQQYEISNFARPGFESRHNNKYWLSEPYLGFGPAAHSFFDGRRFAYPDDLMRYIQSGAVEYEDAVPDAFEYAMLRLRLVKGLNFADYASRGGDVARLKANCRRYQRTGLIECSETDLHLTPEGFLVSNALIAELLL